MCTGDGLSLQGFCLASWDIMKNRIKVDTNQYMSLLPNEYVAVRKNDHEKTINQRRSLCCVYSTHSQLMIVQSKPSLSILKRPWARKGAESQGVSRRPPTHLVRYSSQRGTIPDSIKSLPLKGLLPLENLKWTSMV